MVLFGTLQFFFNFCGVPNNVPIPKHFRSLGAKTLPESGKYRYLLNESDQIKLRECSKFHSVQKL